MSDIFVSYAHQDRDWVARFAESLRQAGGFDIWWDHNILPGEQFDDAIQSAMDQTRCVVVVWSKTSIASRWVRTEAREAARRNILVPVMNEIVMPPLEFRSFETADMSDWQGDAAHDHFDELVGALRLAIERAAAGNQVSEPAPSMPLTVAPDGYQERRPRAISKRTYAIGGTIAAALLIAAFAAWLFTKPASPPATALASLGPEVSTPAAPPARVLPNLTYGIWTLHDAIDDNRTNWNNSVIKFTSQQEVADGLELRGTFTWRFSDTVAGTEEFTGHYVAATRQIFLEGTSVQDAPHGGPNHLAIGSYSATLSVDDRTLLGGRWGQSEKSETGVLSRWQASR